MDNVVRILIVEDLPSDADLAKREITSTLSLCVFEVVEKQEDYLAALERFQPDLIISDYKMPHFDGLTALKLAQQKVPMVPFIILTGSMNEAIAVECMKAGATDYVIKEHIKRLGLAVVSALEQKRLRIEKERVETEERAAQNALRESEERYRSFFDNSIDAVLLTSPDGNILKANAEACHIFGYTEEELRQVGRIGVIDTSDPRLSSALEERNRTGKFKGELTMIRKDGTKFPGEISSAVFRDKDGVVRTSMIIRDITERKWAEKEMTALQEQFRQSQKMEAIGRLAGGIAHDFNNLLTIIKGYSQLFQIDLKESDPRRGNIEQITKATDRASGFIRQLLAFSRRQILEMKILDLNLILRDLERMLRRVIGEDIELIILLADGLGRVKTDQGQFEQVVMNLAVNAKDAMPNGGKLTVETANVDLDEAYACSHIDVIPGHYVMLSVSDTGIGMTSEVREQVFEPFFTTKETGKGTGLGLSTVYGIVKQSEGHIWVYSEPGKGTTFKVYLPKAEGPLDSIDRKVLIGELPHGSETILIVEDEEGVLKLTVDLLTQHGYKALGARNAEDASRLGEQHKGPISLMIADVVMPGIKGPELYGSLASVHPEMKVLYMSGYTEDAIALHGVPEKGMNYIQKPFSMEGLTQKVREVLDK
ncbi:MAG: response regulator [Thermodesulfobacteriota bacterium]|jgi:PAS domain S-box-containing protein